jgi:hypothetical protein
MRKPCNNLLDALPMIDDYRLIIYGTNNLGEPRPHPSLAEGSIKLLANHD